MNKYEDKKLLKGFMQEFFPYQEFKKAGIFTKEMRGDYDAQANRICEYLGLKTIYEYRSTELTAHLSYADGHRPAGEGFVTVLPSIYE